MKRNGMKAGWLLVSALVLIMALTSCSFGRSESEWTLETGYDGYFSAVEDAEGFRDLDVCSMSKEGFVEALRAAADSVSKEALEDGDADEDDIANMDKTIKAFSDEYDEYVDSDDYEPSSIDTAFIDNTNSNVDYQFGLGSAKADMQEYLDAKGPFVRFEEAKEWVSEYMGDLGSDDYFDYVVEDALKEKASEMEGCWIDVYEIKKAQDKE